MGDPSHDPSVANEPHLANRTHSADPSENAATRNLDRDAARTTVHDVVDQTVWDEPALSRELTGGPAPGDVTYAAWLRTYQARTTWSQSLLAMVEIAAVAGPWGIIGALISGSGALGDFGWSGLLMAVLVAPVTEETAKVAAALWVVEKRPFWFKEPWQILFCAAAGGAAFAAIENLLYLYVYVPGAGPEFALWRWTVCVALHVGCSFLAGLGVLRVWRRVDEEASPPRLQLAAAWMIVAMVAHGLYNLAVTVATWLGWLQFDV